MITRRTLHSNALLSRRVSALISVHKPQVGARLVLEHDRHVTASIQVTASDVDDGSPRDWPPAGHQLHDLRDLDVKHKLGGQRSSGK